MKKTITLSLVILTSACFAQQKRATGLVFDPVAYKAVPRHAPMTRSLNDPLPSSASLKQSCPEVDSQGEYGTCTAWATAYAAQTIAWAKANRIKDPSAITNHAFSPHFLYKNIKPNDDNCNDGSSIETSLYFLSSTGSVLLNDFNESCPSSIPEEISNKSKLNKIQKFVTLFDRDASDSFKVNAIKNSLSEEYPVIIGFNTPPSFISWYTGSLWTPSESPYANYGGHALCVIGYDDNKYGGAFEIMNSWGTDFADKGFVWVKYEDFARFTKYAFELQYTKPIPEQPLSAQLRIVMKSGQEIGVGYTGTRGLKTVNDNGNYRLKQPLKSGDKFKFYLKTSVEQYAYIIASDNTEEVTMLFPFDGIDPFLNYKDQEISLPNGDIELDNNAGTDVCIVLLSKEPIDIENVILKVNQLSGNFSDRVKSVLGNRLISESEIIYSADKAEFSTKTPTNKILPLTFSIIHN